MEKLSWPGRVFLKYILLQVPGWALLVCILLLLRKWMALPDWALLAILAGWVGKDLFLFPFVWRAYDSDHEKWRSLVGEQGVVVKSLSPAGYIRIRGELWQAEWIDGGAPPGPGERVVVQGTRGLTLLVARQDPGDKAEDF